MCDPVSIIAGGTAIVGGVLSSRAANRQADAVEDANAQRSRETQAAISQYNQNSPAAALSRTYGTSLTGQIASMLGLVPNAQAPGAQPGGAHFIPQDVLNGWDTNAHNVQQHFNGDRDAYLAAHRRNFPQAYEQNGEVMGPYGSGGYGDAVVTSGPGMGHNGGPPMSTAAETMRSLPGYQFQFNEGMRSVRDHLNGSSSLYSGKALKEIMKYGQNFAETKYQTHLSNMFNAMGVMDGASVNTLNATTGNAARSASAQIAAAGHRNDGTASLVSGISGAAGAITSGMAQPTTPTVDANTIKQNQNQAAVHARA